MKHVALFTCTVLNVLAACVDQPPVPGDDVALVESSATTPPARKLAKNNNLQCNATRSWNWFAAGYTNNPLCVKPSATGSCDAAQIRALQDRITKDHVKCPGCSDGETGCEPRVQLTGGPLGQVVLLGGNCCLRGDAGGLSSSAWFQEWCTTCVGSDCAAQDADTGVCLDDSEDADRTERGVSELPGPE